MVKQLRNQNIFYTIFFNNQLCIKLLNNETVLDKPIHAVRQCIDKGSFLKMTSFGHLVFTRVLVLISSLRPITSMPSLMGHRVCAEAKTNRECLVGPDLITIELLLDELWQRTRDCSVYS